jgi:hypothetical protein
VTDNGIGMTADEVREYINNIAFSGAEAFLNQYKDKATGEQIIGHFGLGFYSSFMVSDLVEIDEAKELVFDFKDLEYISSAGLRVILAYQKKLGGKEHIVIKNMNAVIRSVFQVTGFTRLVTIE